MSSSGWWGFVERVMDHESWTQAEMARRIGIDSSVITGWKNGRQPSTENLRHVSAATGIPMLRLLVESGHLTEAEAGGDLPPLPEKAPVDVLSAIEQDPGLLPEAKAHLTNQYGLLLRVAPTSAAAARKGREIGAKEVPLRAVARRRKGDKEG